MAFTFNPEFQIISDVHLETPLVQPSYQAFKLDLKASYLCLLGDIGLIKDDGLFTFLESLLKRTPNLTILYVFGNHEYYQLSMEMAQKKMDNFVGKMTYSYGNRLIILNRRRYDINGKITILGCTLWSRILDEQLSNANNILTDFNPIRGIQQWDPTKHLEEHARDLEWLNAEVAQIEQSEPHRQILVLTHHSPTYDPRANNPRHKGSTVSSGFVTDLSQEPCWISPLVKSWAFGHTHYSFSYREEATGKLVIANQGGYNRLGALTKSIGKVMIIESMDPVWDVLPEEQMPPTPKKKLNEPKIDSPQGTRGIAEREKSRWRKWLVR
jgi:hypothetical protein